jgi:poly(3-hydroxybutyrate) depolymerase
LAARDGALDWRIALVSLTLPARKRDLLVDSDCTDGASVEWCEVKRMGHVWPTGQTRYGGLDASRTFWEFMAAHPMK